MLRTYIILFLLFLSTVGSGQSSFLANHQPAYPSLYADSTIPHPNSKRIWLVAGAHTVVYAGSLLVLSEAWFKDYPRTGFHTFNDSGEWLQVDKVGHAWSAYNLAKYSTDLWRWTGLPRKKAAWIGTGSSLAYMTIIEALDATSEKWGWSWGDIAANITGTGMFLAQELGWKEQRIQFKFSAHIAEYDSSLQERTDDLFGTSVPEKLLKDYNAQTYWFSFNLKSFFRDSKLPPWLNLAVGYGADGMLGGFENKWEDEQGNEITRYDIPRVRQFYLAPDIDFTKIKTNSKTVRTLLNLLNAIKCPAPALMIDSKGKFRAYFIYF